MNELVTVFGGGGFLGRYVGQALLRAGYRVRIAQRDPRGATYLRTQAGLGQMQFVAADVTLPDTVARAVGGADAVVNLVGSFARMGAINADGAGVVARASADAGVRALVHVSAIGADADGPADYARTKGAGEAVVRVAFPAATILRPSILFGAEDAFTNRFAAMIARLPLLPVLRGGTRFQPAHVADVAEAVARTLADGAHAGRTYELGGPDVLTMREVQEYLAGETGRRARIVELPDAVGAMIAKLGFLPFAPITADQWRMLERDNVVAPGTDGFAALGITPVPMRAVAPRWLVQYRRQGRFAKRAAA